MIGVGRWGCAAIQSVRSVRPRCERVSITSSIDFLPKFGMAASSPSDFDTRSPTVWMPGALEAVVRADAELELLDEDVVHRAAALAAAGGQDAAADAGAVVQLAGPGPGAGPRSRSSSVKIESYEIRISAASRSAA